MFQLLPESRQLNEISIGSAVFAGLTIVTDGQTDRQTDHAAPSVTTDCIGIHSTVTQPRHRVFIVQDRSTDP